MYTSVMWGYSFHEMIFLQGNEPISMYAVSIILLHSKFNKYRPHIQGFQTSLNLAWWIDGLVTFVCLRCCIEEEKMYRKRQKWEKQNEVLLIISFLFDSMIFNYCQGSASISHEKYQNIRPRYITLDFE